MTTLDDVPGNTRDFCLGQVQTNFKNEKHQQILKKLTIYTK